jgi:hypothetical protein
MTTILVNVSDLEGVALALAVCRAEAKHGDWRATYYGSPSVEGCTLYLGGPRDHNRLTFRPDCDGAQGLAIIEREHIEFMSPEHVASKGEPSAWAAGIWCNGTHLHTQTGRTLLEAGMRTFVASRFGKTVQIPEGVLRGQH